MSVKFFKNIFITSLIFFTACSRDIQNKIAESDKLSKKAQIYLEQHNFTEGINTISKVIKINKELHRDSALGENYFLKANLQRYRAQYDSALSDFKVGLDFCRLSGDKKLQIKIKISMAEFYFLFQDYENAKTLAMDAATTSTFFGDSAQQYRALSVAAKACRNLEQYDQEIRIVNNLFQIDSNVNNSKNKYELQKLLFSSAVSRGDYRDARDILEKWKKQADSEANFNTLAQAYYEWGEFQLFLVHPDSAIRSFSQSLYLLNKCNDQDLQSDVLFSLGNLAYRAERYDEAKRYYHDVLPLANSSNRQALVQILNLMLFACDWKTNNPALKHESENPDKNLISAIENCEQMCFFQGEAFAYFIKGRIEEQRNDFVPALKSYHRAIQIYRQNNLHNNDSKINKAIDAFMDREQSDWYDAPLSLYCTLEKVDSSYTLIERRNLDEFNDFFNRVNVRTVNPRLNQILSDYRFKRTALNVLQEDMLQAISSVKENGFEYFSYLKELYGDRVYEASACADEIENINLNYRWLVNSKQLTLPAVRNLLTDKTAVIEFAPSSSALYSLVITPDSEYIRKVPVKRKTLLSVINEYNHLLGDSRLNENTARFNENAVSNRINELSSVLGNYIVSPVISLLNKIEKIYIVLPEEFEWLAVHTLPTQYEGRYIPLIQRFDLVYLPSASVLLFKSPNWKPAEKIVGFGHPGRTAWDVEYEVNDIRSFYREAKLFFDTAATLERIERDNCDVLHIAAEISLDIKVPDNTYILLSDGIVPGSIKEVQIGQIASIEFPPTVIVSNISTNTGGLSRYLPLLFLANGTKTAVLTMWQGERKAKKYFGEIFYTSLLSGFPPDQSYHKAMVELSKQTQHAQIYRWGLFYRFGK